VKTEDNEIVHSEHKQPHKGSINIYSLLYRSVTSCIVFHPVFRSLCFSILCLTFHIIPSSSSVVAVQHCCINASSYDLHLTASSELSFFHTITLSFFLSSQRTRMSYSRNIFTSLLFLLSEEILFNPGPVSHVFPQYVHAVLTSGLSLILFTILSNWMSSNFLSLNPSKTKCLIFGLPQQLSKLNNPTIHLPNNVILSPIDSVRNLGVIFDKDLSFAQHIFSISKSCFLGT